MGKKRKKLPRWMFHEPEWREFGQSETGLPVPVWIDVCGWKPESSPRYIRFVLWDEGYFQNSTPMVISEKPYVPGWPPKRLNLDEEARNVVCKVEKFVARNHEILTDVGLGKIGLMTFEKKLKESVSGDIGGLYVRIG